MGSNLSIVDFPWKYIHHEGGLRHELYSLRDDPGELTNLVASKDGVRERMLAILSRRISDPGSGSHAPMPEEDIERLRALGYVD
ncbi:MAG: hypothetical protein CME06_02050 [Gemmatimonadetes bacterium]|nr:hypothetical protein [Gemmatimonadota bacterium]